MQEYLFRAKEKYTGKWVEGGYAKMTNFDDQENTFIITTPGKGIMNTVLVDPETVGQFTGLIDRTGDKIYEGDAFAFDLEDGFVYIVAYNDGCFRLHVYGHSNAWGRNGYGIVEMNYIDYYYFPNFMKIGNIHDNPELLEGSPCP